MWYWLSFAGDEGHRGAATVYADDEIGAVTRSHELGINPGGEVMIVPAPENLIPDEFKVERRWTPEELRERDDMERLEPS